MIIEIRDFLEKEIFNYHIALNKYFSKSIEKKYEYTGYSMAIQFRGRLREQSIPVGWRTLPICFRQFSLLSGA